MADVLLVTKPLVPPWTDGAKNLARDLVEYCPGRHQLRCMVTRGAPAPRGGFAEPVYSEPGGWRPGLRQNAEAALRLLRPDQSDIYHFFFAPNPRTNTIAGLATGLRRKRSIHTVVSEPTGEPRWFADVHVALTHATGDRLRARGARDVRVIAPGIPGTFRRAPDRTRFGLPQGPVVLFAGDLIDGGGADLLTAAAMKMPDLTVVFACRPKGEGRQARQSRIQAQLGQRALWLGIVDDMAGLLASVDAQCIPATNLHAKMDLPMVLLEGMAQGLPTVVADADPIRELKGAVKVLPHAEALAEQLASVVREGPARQRAQTMALDAVEYYDAAQMAHAYAALYDEVAP